MSVRDLLISTDFHAVCDNPFLLGHLISPYDFQPSFMGHPETLTLQCIENCGDMCGFVPYLREYGSSICKAAADVITPSF